MIRGIRRLLRGNYDAVDYWNDRSDPNNPCGRDPARVAFDTTYISEGVQDSDPILELGPGVGRTFGAYSSGQRVTTVDVSRRYSQELRDVASSLGIRLHQVYLDREHDEFPFEDREFPVGVASQVLLHVSPDVVEHTIGELMRVCNKVVVITRYRHGGQTRTKTSHVFNHDYFKLCTDAGGVMNRVLKKEGRIYFDLEKREGLL